MFLIIELNFFLLNVYYKILISFLSNILLDNMVMIKQLQKNNYYKIYATQMLQRFQENFKIIGQKLLLDHQKLHHIYYYKSKLNFGIYILFIYIHFT